MFTLMEEVLNVLRNIKLENQTLCEYITHLQTNQASTSLGCISTTQPRPKMPWINLPNKFDNTGSKFQGFVNQVHLVTQLHPHWYPTSPTQVELINTLFVKHDLCLVHTFVGSLITLVHQL
jgi:hypothetical protein